LEKTPEQLFINSLRKEYELSPAESTGILELAKSCLFGELPQVLGKQKYLCASRNAKHGRAIKAQEMKEVELTLDGGIEDLDVQRVQGSKSLRQLKVLRITEEAYYQGGLLTQEDIGRLLQVSSRTVREDIRELQKDGNLLRTRGNEHDIGRGISHKSRIIALYLNGYTYDEIIRRSRHSAHSIKRYVNSFGRLLLIKSHGIKNISEISRLLHQSERLTKEYILLYQKHKQEDHWPKVYQELLEQLKVLYPSKKKVRKAVI
jgi:DNA-binding Lrp family transcriptional regulator